MSTVDATFKYLSVSEAAEVLGVTTGRVRQLLLNGKLHGHKLGERQWALDPAEVARRKLEIRTPGKKSGNRG